MSSKAQIYFGGFGLCSYVRKYDKECERNKIKKGHFIIVAGP